MSGSLDSVHRLMDFLGRDNRRELRLCIVVSFVATALIYTIPYTCGLFLNHIVGLHEGDVVDLNFILDMCTGIAVMVIFWYVGTTHSGRKMSLMSLAAGKKIREGLNRKMMNVPVGYVDSVPAGDLTARFTTDLPNVNKLISTDFIGLIVHTTMVAAIAIMMMVTSYQLGLLYLLLLPITILISRRLTIKSESDFRIQREKETELNEQLSDIISSHRTIKAEGLEDRIRNKFQDTNKDFTTAFIAAHKRSSLIAPIVGMNINAGYLITVIVGAIMLLFGEITVGMFLTFMVYVRALNKPLIGTATVFDGVKEEFISLDRILEVLNAPEEESDEEMEDVPVSGSVRFENVSFSYYEDNEILHKVTFEARPGEVTALVGRTGSGKTTVANLLMGFYRPDSGSITIGGVDIRNIPRKSYSTNIAAVLQDPWVFDGTIRENIIYNRKDISEESLTWVAKITGLDDYVSRLPNGYDTVIGNDIKRLPLAQRRMLAMCRAFIGQPNILILDEAVAGLDPISGSSVIEDIFKLIEGRTVIIITHNQALMDLADRVVRLDKGCVVE